MGTTPLSIAQPLVDIEVRGQRVVPRQALRPTRADLKHHSERQPKVVDGGDPSIGVGFRQLQPAAIVRNRV
ncbi:Uncharacterised protein [Mycobacterium tuberculosis]|uniref:Uncharacterized protein n=1 Tax=Mycobacterium tuberculosis TaxID=1773 RepID=A0A655IRV9_MYCTX|nr:Uncharacterised protein [Mycobacterium tuberculosis]